MKPDWTSDWRHVWISGDTGSGKSVLGKQLLHEVDRDVCIYWNPMNLDCFAPEYPATAEGVARGMVESPEAFSLKPHWDEEQSREQFGEILELIFELNEANPELEFLLVADEVHQLAPKGATTPYVRAIKEGRNHNLKLVSISQEPQLVSHSVLRQSRRHIWIGQPNAYAEDYFDNFHVPVDQLRENGPHDALVMNENMETMHRVRASEKYV